MSISANTSAESHVQIGLANPFLMCGLCKGKVKYYHNPDRCGCDDPIYNYPCDHEAELVSRCVSWGPIEGCSCEEPCKK